MLAPQRLEVASDLHRTRTDGPQGTACRTNPAVIPGERDRHPQDREIKRGPAAQFPVRARHSKIRRRELDRGDHLLTSLVRVIDPVVLVELGRGDPSGALDTL